MPKSPEAGGSSSAEQPSQASKWDILTQEASDQKEKAKLFDKNAEKENQKELLNRLANKLGSTVIKAVNLPEPKDPGYSYEDDATALVPDMPEKADGKEDDFQPPAIREEQLPAEVSDKQLPAEIPDKQLPAEQQETPEEELEEESKKHAPLTAINAHRNIDVKERAHELAEERLNAEIQAAKGIKGALAKVVKGSMLRSFFLYKKEKHIINEIRDKQEGESSELSDKEWQNLGQSTIDRFTKASRNEEYSNLVHNDEKIYEENKEATALAKDLISDYASGKIDSEKFNEDIEKVREMLKSDTSLNGEDLAEDNFFQLANEAKARYQNNEAIADIMEGFKVVNADVRTGLKSEVHRNSLDKIVNKVEEMKNKVPGLNLIPGEAIALGVSLGTSIIESSSRTLSKIPKVDAISMAISASLAGGIAAAKEGNRVAEDRTQRMRERAKGLGNEGESKYDKAISETMHEMFKATDLTESINKAKESGKQSDLYAAILNAEAAISHTDETKIDRIAYSSPDKIEDERLALDLAIAEAKANMTKEERSDFERIRVAELKRNYEKMEAEETEKDKLYKKLRHKQMLKVGAKTAAITAATSIISQEVIAAFDPNKFGVIDQIKGWMKGNTGTADSGQTLLSGLLGFKPSSPDAIASQAQQVSESLVQSNAPLTEQQLHYYQNHPDQYKIEAISTPTAKEVTENKSVAEAIKEFGTKIRRLDWGSNGTKVFDGNELRAYYTDGHDGIVTGMFGESGTWHSGNVNFANAVSEGKIKAFITLSEGTSSTPIEVTGKLVNGQMRFIPEPGSAAAACFKDGKFVGKFFEVVYDNGVSGDTQEVIPLATLVGEGLSGNIPVTSQTQVTETLYNVTKTTVPKIIEKVVKNPSIVPFASIPLSSRENLTYSERRQEQPSPAPSEKPNEDFQPPAEVSSEGFQPPAEVSSEGFQPPEAVDQGAANPETNAPQIEDKNGPAMNSTEEGEPQTTPENVKEEEDELFKSIDFSNPFLNKEQITKIDELLSQYPEPTGNGLAEWLKLSEGTRNDVAGNFKRMAADLKTMEKVLKVREKSGALNSELVKLKYWIDHYRNESENEPTTPQEDVNGASEPEPTPVQSAAEAAPEQTTEEQKEGSATEAMKKQLDQYNYPLEEADKQWSELSDSSKASLSDWFRRIAKNKNEFDAFISANNQRTTGVQLIGMFKNWLDKYSEEDEEEQ